MSIKRGKLIILDGNSCTCRDINVETLIKYFLKKNYMVKMYKFPTNIYKMLNDDKNFGNIIEHKLSYISLIDNIEKFLIEVNIDLNKGINIIMDKYIYSTMAYNISKGLGLDWCLKLNINMLKPDHVYFLDKYSYLIREYECYNKSYDHNQYLKTHEILKNQLFDCTFWTNINIYNEPIPKIYTKLQSLILPQLTIA